MKVRRTAFIALGAAAIAAVSMILLPDNDYFFIKFGPPQDVATPQNLSSRNTKDLRSTWDAVPRFAPWGCAQPALGASNIRVIKDTHGKTSQLSATDIDALVMYLKSLDRASKGATQIPPPSTR